MDIRVSDKGLAILRMTNAKQRNPLRKGVLQGIHDFLTSAKENTDGIIKCIVIASTGPVFSSGHDFADFYEKTPGEADEVLMLCAEVNMMLQRVPQPTIAAVQGLATAGGCALASSCDLVVASEEARFCLPGTRGRGFCHTPSVAVADRIHPRKAFEMALLSEEISPQEAVQIGLANRVVPHDELDSAVAQIADKLCRWQNGYNNVASGKATFWEQVRMPTLDERYAHASPVMRDMMASPETQEGFKRFLTGQRKSKAKTKTKN